MSYEDRRRPIRRRRAKLTPEERQEVVRRYVAGDKIYDIATQLKLSVPYISHLANAAGHFRRPHKNAKFC